MPRSDLDGRTEGQLARVSKWALGDGKRALLSRRSSTSAQADTGFQSSLALCKKHYSSPLSSMPTLEFQFSTPKSCKLGLRDRRRNYSSKCFIDMLLGHSSHQRGSGTRARATTYEQLVVTQSTGIKAAAAAGAAAGEYLKDLVGLHAKHTPSCWHEARSSSEINCFLHHLGVPSQAHAREQRHIQTLHLPHSRGHSHLTFKAIQIWIKV